MCKGMNEDGIVTACCSGMAEKNTMMQNILAEDPPEEAP
jgi:hypothetical protein